MNMTMTRRTALGVMAAGATSLAMPYTRAGAQTTATVRALTLQTAPAQIEVYQEIVAAFEAEHPGIKVTIEPIAEASLWPKLSAAYAGGDVPDLILMLASPWAVSLYGSDLLEPMDDVVDMIGKDDFQQNALDAYTDDGKNFAVAMTSNTMQILWYRKDLFEEAGVEIPTYWDELVDAASKTTKNGIFGTTLPYGTTALTNSLMWVWVYQAGGRIIAPDNSVVFNSDATVQALEFLKEIRQYCPTGANTYDYGDTLNSFVAGASASTTYTGRTLVNVMTRNPDIADKIACAPYPYMRGGVPWRSNPFEGHVIPKGAKNVEAAKLFAAWTFKKDQYIKFLSKTPGHHFPVLNSILAAPEYQSDPLLIRYKEQVDIMQKTTAQTFSNAKPTADSPFIFKTGDLQGSGIFAEAIQRVVIRGESAKSVAIWGQDEIAKVMAG